VAIRIPSGNPPSDLEYSSSLPDASFRAIGSSPATGQEWSAIECGRALYRHKIPLLLIAGLGILLGALTSAVQPRMYRSQASVQIQGINENFLNLRDVYPTAAPSADNAVYVQTQAEMLRQDALIEQVVTKLRLEEQPEFRGVLRPLNGFSPKVASWTPATWAAVANVKKNLQIAPSRGSSIIRIECEARDPQLATDIANTLAQTFIEQSIEARQQAAKQTLASLSLELEALRKTLLKSETALDAYGRETGEDGRRQSVIGLGRLPWETSYNPFKRELDANRQFYEVISRRVDEARVASTVRQSNVRLVGPAQPAAHPHKPNVPLNLAIGMFGGMALAVGYVMLREQTSSVLRAPGEAGAYLALSELGAIPKATNRKFAVLGFLGAGIRTLPVERASLEQPSSDLSEAFRGTVASILSAGHNVDHPRILVVTSSRPMEGKTTVVSNLGIALAEIGSKVLLIDGDLRRPRLHKVFDQINSWGLSDMLREKNAIEELPLEALVKRTTIPHLHLLPSGTCADNIFGLLCSSRMARLLQRFRQEFDYVLVDAPPCLEFADARIMAWYAETLLLVVRADYTDRKTAQAAVRRLLLDGTPVMGVIFNYWDPSNNELYGYGRYHQDLA
jgi:succinoglycan biosynthesis transport protein ExoP